MGAGAREVRPVLPIHDLAWLAWRINYAAKAAASLAGPERARMGALRDARLGSIVGALGPA